MIFRKCSNGISDSKLQGECFRDSLSGLGFGKLVEHVGDLTLEDLRSERELKVFETLERKVDNSSFCSTNTSILNLLVSTPQKLKRSVGQNEAIAEGMHKNLTADSRLHLKNCGRKTLI